MVERIQALYAVGSWEGCSSLQPPMACTNTCMSLTLCMRKGRQRKAWRLTWGKMMTCWHDCKGAVAAQDALNDWQLQAPEAAEAKCGLQSSCQGLLRYCLFWQGTWSWHCSRQGISCQTVCSFICRLCILYSTSSFMKCCAAARCDNVCGASYR